MPTRTRSKGLAWRHDVASVNRSAPKENCKTARSLRVACKAKVALGRPARRTPSPRSAACTVWSSGARLEGVAVGWRSRASGVERKRDHEDVVKDLHAKIGELKVERRFLPSRSIAEPVRA